MPRGVHLDGGRALESASRRQGLPLVVLLLVDTLSAHAVDVVAGAGMLDPGVTTLGTVAQLPDAAGMKQPLPASLKEATHSTEHAGPHIRTCRGRGGLSMPLSGRDARLCRESLDRPSGRSVCRRAAGRPADLLASAPVAVTARASRSLSPP